MHIAGHPYQVLTDREIQLIHTSAMRILAEVGMQIQNEGLPSALILSYLLISRAFIFPPNVADRWLGA
jgi:hypothetical protein